MHMYTANYIHVFRRPLKLIKKASCNFALNKVIFYSLDETLKEYEAVQASIPTVLVPLMEPFKERVENALRPGLITHTWTSLNFQNCKLLQ